MASSDPTAAAQEFARMAADLEQKAQRYQDLRGRMTALAVTEESADGKVRISVDANGVPTEITLTERARGADPAALSAQIMSCLAAAQTRLREQVAGLVHDTVGNDSAGEMIVGQYTERFPGPVPEGPGVPSPTPPERSGEPAPPVTPTWPATPDPAARGSWRDAVVTPHEPDEDDLYFERKSWFE